MVSPTCLVERNLVLIPGIQWGSIHSRVMHGVSSQATAHLHLPEDVAYTFLSHLSFLSIGQYVVKKHESITSPKLLLRNPHFFPLLHLYSLWDEGMGFSTRNPKYAGFCACLQDDDTNSSLDCCPFPSTSRSLDGHVCTNNHPRHPLLS